ncbi:MULTISPECIES: CBS domain-containing protein [unclassified Streptomyces]|uniref:CBS domain-containing protein n=1 Tax=unclassified Streptomyces TaxID=2593676 RepID=UPI0036AAD8D6
MTSAGTQPRPPSSTPADGVTAVRTVPEAEPQVWDDMTVEVALSVMASARAGHLVIRDGDGRRTGLVTRAQLAAFRATAAYTDRVRLRDLLGRRLRAAAVRTS